MSDIFVSYARQDELAAERLAHALEAVGWSVWWDRKIPFGRPFDEVIDEALRDARCVVVMWSASAIRSRWVLEEAHYAFERDILVPVSIDHAPPPLGFRRAQTARLADWNGDGSWPAFQKLLADIESVLALPARDARSRESPETISHRRRAAQAEHSAWREPRRRSLFPGLKQFAVAAALLGFGALVLGERKPTTPPNQSAKVEQPAAPVTAARPPPDPRAALVRDAQQELKRLGFYRGRVDGIWGPRSTAALKAFQRDQGLEPTGVLTSDLLERLKRAPIPQEPEPPPPQVGTAKVPDPFGRMPTPIAPERPPPSKHETPSASGCIVTITNRLVPLQYQPGNLKAQILRVPVGDYAVVSHTWVTWIEEELWFKIRVNGREGWVKGDNWSIAERRGSGCP